MKAFSLSIVLAGLSVGLTAEPSWPTFHGSLRDNMSRETGLLKEWPADGPRLVWKFSGCGKGYASVNIANGLVFTSGDFDDVEMLLALDMDGKLKWKVPHGKAWRGAQPGSRTTPTYSDGMIFHLGPHGSLSAFEAATGKQVWTVDIKTRFDAMHGNWGYTENVVVDGDRVFCVPGGAKGRVVALNKKTGETIWANTKIPDRAAYCSPILVEHGGVRQLITLAHSTVFGVDVRSGKLLWLHEHRSTCDQNVTSPIYHDGCVFVSSGHKAGGRVFRISADNRKTEEFWYGMRLDNCHGGVMLLDGYLYGSGCRMYNKGLHCVKFATGEVMYSAKEIGKTSLTYADGLLYCYSNDGEMMLVKPTPQAATIISRFRPPKEGKDPSLSHPVICGGRLYVRHLDDLFAYDIRAGK